MPSEKASGYLKTLTNISIFMLDQHWLKGSRLPGRHTELHIKNSAFSIRSQLHFDRLFQCGSILWLRATLFCMVALTTAVTKNLFMQPFFNQTPYSWIRKVLWYEWYLYYNLMFSGFLCTHGMILVEILTVYDVIIHLWRHCSCIDDVIWFNSSWYDNTCPFLWSCQVSSQMGYFSALRTNSPIQGVFQQQLTGSQNSSLQGYNTK